MNSSMHSQKPGHTRCAAASHVEDLTLKEPKSEETVPFCAVVHNKGVTV